MHLWLYLCQTSTQLGHINTSENDSHCGVMHPACEQKFGNKRSHEFYSWWTTVVTCNTTDRHPASMYVLLGWYDMEEWSFVDDRELTNCCCQRICITCEHFTYGVDAHCRTIVVCRIREQQLQQGQHLTKVCKRWSPTWESTQGWEQWRQTPLPNPLPTNV